jgi:hypothetical protein
MKEQVATQATIRDDTSCTPSITVMAAENLEGQVIEHLRDKVILFHHHQVNLGVWTFKHYQFNFNRNECSA